LFNLSSGTTYEQDSDEFVLRAVRKSVADARKLAKSG
jgi:hypothetical protein